jgi:hypothetical protein
VLLGQLSTKRDEFVRERKESSKREEEKQLSKLPGSSESRKHKGSTIRFWPIELNTSKRVTTTYSKFKKIIQ